ncbi:oligogalacturonate-specific porin KdgM family protein [Vibrio rarus]|uniref:oligogalacturonate-specific porin KdgM family protein n=1 Tax=Vibrio rarus TaxID=413403 RepID=UPI0021C3C78E|nr:oligogalacturonate-specific porin KdgM family protein [Vibrio rarus]
MKTNKIALAVIATLFAGTVSASSIDYRHEYKAGRQQHQNRVKLSTSVQAWKFASEVKFGGSKIDGEYPSAFKNLAMTSSELTIEHKTKLTKHLYIQPGFDLTLNPTSVVYKPQVRVGYKFPMGITTKLRYRHEFRRYTEGSSMTGIDGDKYTAVNRSKFTANVTYKFKFGLGFDLESNFAQDFFNNTWAMGSTKRGQNVHYEWDYNVLAYYRPQGWNFQPYFELGNIQASSPSNDKRELRTRVGLKYNF